MKKLALLFLATQLISVGAYADICAYAPDMDLAKISQLLAGTELAQEFSQVGQDRVQGKFVDLSLESNDPDSIKIDVSATGIYDQSAQTIREADLGHMVLICPDRSEHNLAGALLKSGVACTISQVVPYIPRENVNVKCQPVR